MDGQDITDVKVLSVQIMGLQGSITALTTTVTSLTASMNALERALPEKFMPRVEFEGILRQKEQQQEDIDKRLDRAEKKDDAQDLALLALEKAGTNRAYALLIALIATSASLILGFANLFLNIPHK